MSSRLLTMKFMQRGAASSPLKRPTEPEAGQPPSKRRKSDMASRAVEEDAERAAQAALAAEETQRQRVLERQAAQAGDTKWTIDIPDDGIRQSGVGFNVITASYSHIDSADSKSAGDTEQEEGKTVQSSGRRSFGNFGKNTEPAPGTRSTKQSDDDSEDSDSGSGNSSDEEHRRSSARRATSQAGERQRDDRHARRQEKAAESARQAEKRRAKDVKLNNLTSISSGGALKSKGSPSSANMVCFRCGGKGHSKRDCLAALGSGSKRF